MQNAIIPAGAAAALHTQGHVAGIKAEIKLPAGLTPLTDLNNGVASLKYVPDCNSLFCQAGDAVIQVSQGRQPCWKLNIRFDTGDMAFRVQRSGRTGWYYRVLQEGNVKAGDTLQRIERPSPEWTIRKAWHLLYVDTMNLAELSVMAELEHLAQNWRDYAIKRLASRKVEDWSRRLQG